MGNNLGRWQILELWLGNEYDASLEPATSAWLRYAFATCAFFSLFVIRKGSGGFRILPEGMESWKFSIWLGVFGTMCYQLFFAHGMKWTAAGDASLIVSLNPVFTVLLASPMLGQNVSGRMALGLLVGISGVFVVVGWSPNRKFHSDHRLLGGLFILFAALCWAATNNLTKLLLSLQKEVSPLEIVVWYSVIGWVMLTPWMIFEILKSGFPDPKKSQSGQQWPT